MNKQMKFNFNANIGTFFDGEKEIPIRNSDDINRIRTEYGDAWADLINFDFDDRHDRIPKWVKV